MAAGRAEDDGKIGENESVAKYSRNRGLIVSLTIVVEEVSSIFS